MKKLDRYIIGQFLYILGLSLVAFVGIFIFGDTFEQLDKFVDKKASVSLVVQYYLYYMPFILVLTLPVAMLLSSLFSMGQLAKNNELIAMRACGISLYRTLLPLFVLGLFISFLTQLWGEYVVPAANEKKIEVMNYEIKKKARQQRVLKRDIYVQEEDGTIWYVKLYDSKLKRATSVSICRYNGPALSRRIDAATAWWKDGSWRLRSGFVRTFRGTEETAEQFDSLEVTQTQVTPQDIIRKKKSPDEMNYFELKAFIEKARRSGQEVKKWLVDLHLKIAFPLANFIIVLFGAPLMANRKRGGNAWGFGVSLFICFFYYGIIRTGQSLGYNGTLPPLLAAWIGNAIFGLAGIFILVKVKK